MFFPYGLGGVTGQDRIVRISMTEANAHLLRYCIRHQAVGKVEYSYPFANHPTWMYWAQNTVERHRHQTQKSVCLNNNPGDQNITEEELEQIISEGGLNFERLIGRMQTYNSNIAGSNAYFYKKKRELHALIAQEGMCTLWFTFSAADNHWTDLFGSFLVIVKHKRTETKMKRRRLLLDDH